MRSLEKNTGSMQMYDFLSFHSSKLVAVLGLKKNRRQRGANTFHNNTKDHFFIQGLHLSNNNNKTFYFP